MFNLNFSFKVICKSKKKLAKLSVQCEDPLQDKNSTENKNIQP